LRATLGGRLWTNAGYVERSIGAFALSASGGTIVSVCNRQDLMVWDTTSGKDLRTFGTGHANWITACALSPDGSTIVTASDDRTLRIIDCASGAERATLAGHTGPVTACTFSPDGTFVVSASDDRTLRIWEADSGAERAALAGHTGKITAGAVSPDGAFVVSAGCDRTVRVWDAVSGEARSTLVLPNDVLCLAVHPTRPLVVCGSNGGGVYGVDLLAVRLGPLIVTAWKVPASWWTFWRRLGGRRLAVGCPACRAWSMVRESALGAESPCPRCRQPLKLSRTVVTADWHPVAAAWLARRERVAGSANGSAPTSARGE